MTEIVTPFTPYMATLGGFLIGLSAVILMATNGRIAGMTGILNGVIPPMESDWRWRALFISGAIAGPILLWALTGHAIEIGVPVTTTMMVVGGLIVGIGVTYGSGCTSGHGVCGMARFSPRSIVATIVFMTTTFITVYVVRHVLAL